MKHEQSRRLWPLALGALGVVYGIAVTLTMDITTLLLLILTHEKWKWPAWILVPFAFVFLSIDLIFLASNIFKIPQMRLVPTGCCLTGLYSTHYLETRHSARNGKVVNWWIITGTIFRWY